MTTQQWDMHKEHMENHITWPASRQDIVAACIGEDVESPVMEELKNLPDRQYSSAADVKALLVK